MLLALTLLLGCPDSTLPEFESAKALALRDPGAAPAEWKPDAVLTLSAPLIDDVVDAGLQRNGTFSGSYSRRVLGATVELEPELQVKSMTLRGTRRCEQCIDLAAHLEGEVTHRIAKRPPEAIPVTVDTRVELRLDVRQEGDAFVIEAKPTALNDLEVALGGRAKALSPVITELMSGWATERISASARPIELTRVGGDDFPLRAVKVLPSGEAIRIAMLTRAPEPGVVSVAPRDAGAGWRLDAAQASLLGLARAAAFRNGPVGYDVVPEPTSMNLGDGRFDLGLRLWKTSGGGWWRDYDVAGTVKIDSGKITLAPVEVEQTAASPGATAADPLASLGEGLILDTIRDSVSTTVPAMYRGNAPGVTADVAVTGVKGERGVLTVLGTVDAAVQKRGVVGR